LDERSRTRSTINHDYRARRRRPEAGSGPGDNQRRDIGIVPGQRQFVTRPAVITNPGSTLLSGRHSVVLQKKKKKKKNLRFIATVAVATGHDISNADTTPTIPPRGDKGSSVLSLSLSLSFSLLLRFDRLSPVI